MSDPVETARVGLLFWFFITLVWTAIPVIIIVMAVNGVKEEISRLADALTEQNRQGGSLDG